jgi:PHD/YefM family antitoxin component YafN of YafNO toxin-antitoxin module
METIHLLSNPANAKDLLDGIAEAKAGKFVEHDLIEG